MSEQNDRFILHISPIRDAMGTEIFILFGPDDDLRFSKVNIRSMLYALPPIEQVKSILGAVCKIDSPWIKCSERLPENGQSVIAYQKSDVDFETASLYYVVSGYFNGQKFNLDDGSSDEYPITHWMPLPEPPKE